MNIFQNSIARFQKISGIDFHILATILFRGWGVLAGSITVVLLPIWLTPSEQGYYFTFGSILGIQIFFELGLNQIVMQLVSHEVSHLHEDECGQFVGHTIHLDKISSLVAMNNRWYAIAAILFALICGILGIFFFPKKELSSDVAWLGIWLILVGVTAVNLWFSPKLAVMEGLGRVGYVARLRLLQSIVGYLILWMALYFGAGLWVSLVVPLAAALCSYYWLRFRATQLLWLSQREFSPMNRINWRNDVFPLQWRIGLSWASGYLIFSLFTPMVFINQGPVAAGQLGVALAIFASISAVGMSWIGAKVPNFVLHIAKGDKKNLDLLFKHLLIRSTIMIFICAISFLGIVQYLTYLNLEIVRRLVPLDVLVLLAIATIVNSLIFGMATYMRAHREEPMLLQSIMVGILTALAVYFGSRYGIFTMIFLYMLICVFISLPWTLWLYKKYYIKK